MYAGVQNDEEAEDSRFLAGFDRIEQRSAYRNSRVNRRRRLLSE